MCRLNGHTCLWKDCPNNPSLKKYNGTHYFKIWKQERASTPSKNENKSTESNDKQSEWKIGSQKKQRYKSHGEVDSIDSNINYSIPMANFIQVRDSLKSEHSLHSKSTISKSEYL